METWVVTVSIDATVAGVKLFVQEATITLGVDAIPTIELSCAPSKDGEHVPLKPNVAAPKVSYFSELYKDLGSKADGLKETGNVSITLSDGQGHSQSIKLKDWILSGVGLSNVSASAAPYMSVVLQHPICRLTKVGSIYETPKSPLDNWINGKVSGKDLLEIIESVYKCVREADDAFWPAENDYPSMFRHRLGTGEYDPKKYLEFKSDGGSGIFLTAMAEDLEERMIQAIGRIVLPEEGGSSTWDMITSAAGTLLMSITQDESRNYTTGKLVLEPTQPWKGATITLNDSDCFWTELPGVDPFKLTGVMCRKLGPYSGVDLSLGLMANGVGNEEDPVCEVMYSPLFVDVSNGRIIKTNAPGVLESAFRRDAGYGLALSQEDVELAQTIAGNYYLPLVSYAQAVYEISAKSMSRAKAQMSARFKDRSGNMILPGNTCVFRSEGKDIYYGYARQVVHHLSTSGGNSTTIDMAYVRPEADYKIDGEPAIYSGSKNSAYN